MPFSLLLEKPTFRRRWIKLYRVLKRWVFASSIYTRHNNLPDLWTFYFLYPVMWLPVLFIVWLLLEWFISYQQILITFSGNVDNGSRKRCLHIPDVLVSWGNLISNAVGYLTPYYCCLYTCTLYYGCKLQYVIKLAMPSISELFKCFCLVNNVIIMTKSGKMFIDISKNRQNSNNAAKLRSMYTFHCVFSSWRSGK